MFPKGNLNNALQVKMYAVLKIASWVKDRPAVLKITSRGQDDCVVLKIAQTFGEYRCLPPCTVENQMDYVKLKIDIGNERYTL